MNSRILVSFMFVLVCSSFIPIHQTNSRHLKFGPSPIIGRWSTSLASVDGKTIIVVPLTVKADAGLAYGLDGLAEMRSASDWVLFGNCSTDGLSWTGYWSNSDGRAKGTFSLTVSGSTIRGTYTQSGYTGSFAWSGTRL